MRIFIVENHPDTLKYFRLYLEALGHTVCDSSSMTNALAEVPAAKCDVLISDVGLSDGDGWELLRRLRTQGLAHPKYSIATSGFGMNADKLKSKAAGYRHHLLKPFEPKELEAMLDEAAREVASA